MVAPWRTWWKGAATGCARRPPLVLINGLAEQPETWYRNVPAWTPHFDVHTPRLLVYEGVALQRRLARQLPITVNYLVQQLYRYLDEFVQTPPYPLAANSLGCKVAVEFAVRYPERVDRLVLIGPSGLSAHERLPLLTGVHWSDLQALVRSAFYQPQRVDPQLLAYYQRQFTRRAWRKALLRTVRGTRHQRVRERLARVACPTLLIIGCDDRIVNPAQSAEAGRLLPQGTIRLLPRCGHAPQIECATEVNKLVLRFLTQPLPPACRPSASSREESLASVP